MSNDDEDTITWMIAATIRKVCDGIAEVFVGKKMIARIRNYNSLNGLWNFEDQDGERVYLGGHNLADTLDLVLEHFGYR